MMQQELNNGVIENRVIDDINQFLPTNFENPSFPQDEGSEANLISISEIAGSSTPGESRNTTKADSMERNFAIHPGMDGPAIGTIRFRYSFGEQLSGEIKMQFASVEAFTKYSGMGLKAFMRYAFTQLGIHRLSINLPYWVEDEIRLIEDAGFLREAQRRQAIFYNGQYYDELTYGILRPEWEKNNEEGTQWTNYCCAENA